MTPADGTKLLATLAESAAPLASSAEQLRLLERTKVKDALGGDFDAHVAHTSIGNLR